MVLRVVNIAHTFAGRFGLDVNPKELERFIKFVSVGFIGFLVDFGIFNLTRPFWIWIAPTEGWRDITLTIGTVFAFLMAVISNFTWNRYWTYPDSRSKPIGQQFTQFAAVNFAGFIARPTFFFFTHNWYGELVQTVLPQISVETASTLGDNICIASIVFLVMFWNFFVNRYWTYRDVDFVETEEDKLANNSSPKEMMADLLHEGESFEAEDSQPVSKLPKR